MLLMIITAFGMLYFNCLYYTFIDLLYKQLCKKVKRICHST